VTAPPRPRAMAPECTWQECGDCAIVANHYERPWSRRFVTAHYCVAHSPISMKANGGDGRKDSFGRFDRYEPLLLAYIDSPEWTLLELWMWEMHRLLYEPSDHRPKRREVKKHWHVWFNAGNGIARCPCGEEDASFAVGNMRHGLLLLRQETP